MRRLLRIALNTATLTSLVLCVATLALWVRSYLAVDTVRWEHVGQYGFLCSTMGSLQLSHTWYYAPPEFVGEDRGLSHQSSPTSAGTYKWDVPWHGFRFGRGGENSSARHYDEVLATCPLWAVALVTAALPALRIRGLARRRKFATGCCPGCGYDLRGTPFRCPECGTTPGDRNRVPQDATAAAARGDARVRTAPRHVRPVARSIGVLAILALGAAAFRWLALDRVPMPSPNRPTNIATSSPASPTPAPWDGHYRLTGESVFMRIADGGGVVTDTIDIAAPVELLQYQGQWSRVRTADGRVGLVPSDRLIPKVPSVSPEPYAAEPDDTTKGP